MAPMRGVRWTADFVAQALLSRAPAIGIRQVFVEDRLRALRARLSGDSQGPTLAAPPTPTVVEGDRPPDDIRLPTMCPTRPHQSLSETCYSG